MKIGFLLIIGLSSLSLWSGEPQRDLDKTWSRIYDNDQDNIKRILDFLKESPSGNALVQKALKKTSQWNKSLFDVIHAGQGSITDNTLTRRFHPDNALEVVYDTQSVIFLNKHLSTYHAVLDLAHELTHFIYRENFNPYVDHFTVKKFVESTIEGQGGEVDAFLVECQVHKELFLYTGTQRSGCDTAYDSDKKVYSKEKASSLFYQLGPFLDQFISRLDSDSQKKIDSLFPMISNKPVQFYSSAHSLPYPMAALLEYESVLGAACKNDKRRLKYIQSSFSKSKESERYLKLYHLLVESFENRCQDFII
ncbi:MAG: hypothetical protein H6621_02120 [Halobacteriovoraceae bacterium]|nr:hypothetical protein [Halobacteriovoraceae bacterium]MCB9093839.1 hypothetical protein [Halobacteriovoraceae bacterium]